MVEIGDIIKLLRPVHWYKNFLVFIGIIFSGKIFFFDFVILSLLGFASLCLVSSANYILNDIVDFKRDKINPEKKSNGIPSGKIGFGFAFFLIIAFLIFGLLIAYRVGFEFFILISLFFILTSLYSFFFKNIIFADIIFIGINFILRAVSGAFIIKEFPSPWLILGAFVLSLFLSSGKRLGEINLLGEFAGKYRPVLERYSKELLNNLVNIFLTLVIVVFSIYTFSSEFKWLFIITPLFYFVSLRYYYLIKIRGDIARSPHKAFFDLQFNIGLTLFSILSFVIIVLLK